MTHSRRNFLAGLAALGGSMVLRRAEAVVELATPSQVERFGDAERSWWDFFGSETASVVLDRFPYFAPWLPEGWKVIRGFDPSSPRRSQWARVQVQHHETGEVKKLFANEVYAMLQSGSRSSGSRALPGFRRSETRSARAASRRYEAMAWRSSR